VEGVGRGFSGMKGVHRRRLPSVLFRRCVTPRAFYEFPRRPSGAGLGLTLSHICTKMDGPTPLTGATGATRLETTVQYRNTLQRTLISRTWYAFNA
jgi:hypothetical protein